MEDDDCPRPFPESGRDGEFAVKGAYAVADSLQPKMAFGRTGRRIDVESAAVVRAGELEPFAVKGTCDAKRFCLAVPNGVVDKFAEDS